MSVKLYYWKYSSDMLPRPDTDVEITIEGENRNYEVYNKLNSLLMLTCFIKKTAYWFLYWRSEQGYTNPGDQVAGENYFYYGGPPVLVGPKYGTRSVSPFWFLYFFGGFEIFEIFVDYSFGMLPVVLKTGGCIR